MGAWVARICGQTVVFRLSFVVALIAAALPIVRLGRLIRTEDTSAWLFIIAGASCSECSPRGRYGHIADRCSWWPA